MAKKKTASTVLSEDFTISLKLGDEIFKSKGDTMLEAISTLPIPRKIFLKGILTLKHGDSVRELALTVPRLKRLFYKVSQNLLAKQYELLIK